LHWALLSALFAGLTAVLAKAGTKDVDANVATAIRTAVVLLLAWGIVFAQGRIWDSSIPSQTLLFLVLSGVATGLSWLCYFRALQMGDASLVAPIDKLSVVVAIVLAVVFLGEKLSLQHCIGGILIVAGSIVIALR
jgi:bacterial/archaeal transporter family protein